MKNISLISILLLIFTACGTKAEKEETAGVNEAQIEKPAKKEFRKLNVDKEWKENPFTWFKGSGLLLAVGDRQNNNAMTIGWGALGNVWGSIGANTVTVYVAEERYTYEFMEKYPYFTVMGFEEDQAHILNYMGTHSGRDENKAAALGLHTLFTENGTPYYEEASIVLECETIYKAPFEKEGMCASAQKFYENFDAGVHHLYIGNILTALIKE